MDTETYTAPDQECWRRKEIPPTKLAAAHTSVGAHHDRTFTIVIDPEVQYKYAGQCHLNLRESHRARSDHGYGRPRTARSSSSVA